MSTVWLLYDLEDALNTSVFATQELVEECLRTYVPEWYDDTFKFDHIDDDGRIVVLDTKNKQVEYMKFYEAHPSTVLQSKTWEEEQL